MDEILIANFMIFQEVLEQEHYDLVIADEAWDVDHYWHEHPELKKAQMAWLTDFVGWVPMPENGAHEAFLTTDYNAEMIGHVEGHPELRDRAAPSLTVSISKPLTAMASASVTCVSAMTAMSEWHSRLLTG